MEDLGRAGRRLLRLGLGWVRAEEEATPARVLAEHLGPEVADFAAVGETWPDWEQVNLQAGLEAWLAEGGRTHRLLGLTGFQHQPFTLADLAQPEAQLPWLKMGSVAMATVASGPDGATRQCVRCGLYLVREGEVPIALLLRSADDRHGPDTVVALDALCADTEVAERVIAEVRRSALDHNVFRGQVVSFAGQVFGPRRASLRFVPRPHLTREGLVLPPGMLEEVEGQVVGVARHSERLRALGLHLKRGLLLHGPPGTGKTHTVRYLLSQLREHTVVIVSGDTIHLVGQACSIARALQPALVVVEDVDLVADARGQHPGQHPLLFLLLNEMDGLDEDVDVTFLLTTNRADILEPALAARPGRVDLAVEIPLPDEECRRRLIQLYRGGLELEPGAAEELAAGTEGVAASFIKELLRRAALTAAESSAEDGALRVGSEQARAARERLLGERSRLTRVLLGAEPAQTSEVGPEQGRDAWTGHGVG
ncbi:MAG: AAA family ATPase [Candidatus Dormibacteria bacterium]